MAVKSRLMNSSVVVEMPITMKRPDNMLRSLIDGMCDRFTNADCYDR